MDLSSQHELLDQLDRGDSFVDRLKVCVSYPLRAQSVDILQMNITRRCNLSCRHCHLDGSPSRMEEMTKKDMEACLQAAEHPGITILDITGGAPELHPYFEWFLRKAAKISKRLMVRSNAVILLDKAYRRFLDIYSDLGVEVVASLPNLHRERTDRMRGEGSFDLIIEALRELNTRGYGKPDTGLTMDLIHNPVGAFIPGLQHSLESQYRKELQRDHGIEFNRLYCLTNCPVGRYLDFLKCSGNLNEYMNLLKQAFNPVAVDNVMCRTTLSVGCDGRVFDCDFNQALDLSVAAGVPSHIRDFDFERLAEREIVVKSHCFSCTAGNGSSCKGALDFTSES